MSTLPYCCNDGRGYVVCPVHGYTSKISDDQLDTLIEGLQVYAKKNVYDPWYLIDGSIVQPLDALLELRSLRKLVKTK